MRWTPDTTGATRFEGRTAEEAMARARAALGTSSDLRCWKTRRGGVAGFFATEVFVASIEPPQGMETKGLTTSRAQRKGSKNRAGDATAAAGPDAADEPGLGTAQGAGWTGELDSALRQEREAAGPGPDDLLSGLVEATSDEVSLRSVSIPPEAFHDVLAQAQAALIRHAESEGPTDPPTPPAPTAAMPAPPEEGLAEDELPPPPEATRTATPTEFSKGPTVPKRTRKSTPPKAKPEPARRKPAARRPRRIEADYGEESGILPDLGAGLLALGLEDCYLPRGQRPSLDALARAMGRVPAAPPLPTSPGALVAVVGCHPQLDRTIDLVSSILSLPQRDVLRPGDDSRLDRQLARRRGCGRTTLVAVESGPGMATEHPAAQLERVAPDFVLAAVGAQSKREDVAHWVDGLVTVDALALWDLDSTRTPAELLGAVPIAFVDGEPNSPLAWTLVLAGRAMARQR